MTIVRIISGSLEGYDRAWDRITSGCDPRGCRISKPRVGIPMPSDILVVCDEVGTVPPGKFASSTGIAGCICLGCWLLWSGFHKEFLFWIFFSCVCLGDNNRSDDSWRVYLGSPRNQDLLTDQEFLFWTEFVLLDNLACIDFVLLRETLGGITRLDRIGKTYDRWNFYGVIRM